MSYTGFVFPSAAAVIAVVGCALLSPLSAQHTQFAKATTDATSAGTSLGSAFRPSVPLVSYAARLRTLPPEGPMSSRGSNVAKGALIGGGVGLAVGIAAYVVQKNQCDPALDDCGDLDVYACPIAAGFTVLGVIIGTLVGLLVPTGDSDTNAGIGPGGLRLAVIPAGQRIAVGVNLRF